MNNMFTVIESSDIKGIDSDLIADEYKDLLNDITCVICLQVVINPKTCKNCNSIFCENCINEWIQRNKICPLRCNYIPSEISKLARSFLSKMKFKCQNSKKGCMSILSYEFFFEHLKNECEMSDYMCKACNTIGSKRIIIMHLSICEEISEECHLCKNYYKRKELGKHYVSCPEKLLNCNKCGKNYKYGDKESHIYDCCISECNYCKIKFRTYEDKDNHSRDICFTNIIKEYSNNFNSLNTENQRLKNIITEKERNLQVYHSKLENSQLYIKEQEKLINELRIKDENNMKIIETKENVIRRLSEDTQMINNKKYALGNNRYQANENDKCKNQ